MEQVALVTKAVRPSGVGAGDQSLGAPGDVGAERSGAILVELGVQVVQQSHGCVAGFVSVDLEGGEDQGEEEAPALARRRLLGGISPVEEQPDGVAVRTGQAATGGPLPGAKMSELGGEGLAGLGLAARDVGSNLHRVVLAGGTEPVVESGREASAIGGSALAEAGTELHEALGPDGEVRAIVLECDIAMPENPLEGASVGAVGGPQGTCRAIEKLATLSHGSSNDPQTIRRVDHHLQSSVVVPRNDIAAVDAEAAPSPLQLDLEGAGALLPGDFTSCPQPLRPPADEGQRVLGSEGAPPCQKSNRLQEGGLSLGIVAVKDVQTGMKVDRHVTYVAEIVDDEVSQPDQARASRSAWA
jgi:hypothetical protein